MEEWINFAETPEIFGTPKFFKPLWSRKFKTFAIKSSYTWTVDSEVLNIMKQLSSRGVVPSTSRGSTVTDIVPRNDDSGVATNKFRELDFDPIEKLVAQVRDIDRLIDVELSLDNPRTSFLSTLMATKSKILEVLLPYKYHKALPSRELLEDSVPPLRIILENDDEDDVIDV